VREKLFPFGRGNVTKLGLAYFFATLYFYIPVSPLYLQSKGLNFVQINSLWGIIVGTMFLTEVPTGIIADRIGRKRSINIAFALQLVGEVIFIFARSYWPFAAAAAVGGLGFAFSSGAAEALVFDSLKIEQREDEMSKAMGFVNAAQRSANLIAFTVGGLLIIDLSQERFVLAIVVTACAVFIGWLISLTLHESRSTAAPEGQNRSLQLVRDGMILLRDDKRFRRLVLLAVATVPFIDYLLNLYPPRFVALGVPSIWLGLALAVASALSILGARYAYWVEAQLGARRSFVLVTSLPGVLYLIMAAVVYPALAVLGFCALYASTSLKDPIFSGHLNRHIESKNRATVLSLISMFSGVYVALMGLLIGRIADVSLTYAFLFTGIVILTGSLLFRVD
jgi:MFS family permease